MLVYIIIQPTRGLPICLNVNIGLILPQVISTLQDEVFMAVQSTRLRSSSSIARSSKQPHILHRHFRFKTNFFSSVVPNALCRQHEKEHSPLKIMLIWQRGRNPSRKRKGMDSSLCFQMQEGKSENTQNY